MKTNKLMILILSIAALMALLVSCGPKNDTGDQAAGGDDRPYIPMVSQGFQHAYWLAVEDGGEAAAEEFNVRITFEGPESETQVDKQMEQLQAAIDKNPDAICFAPLDAKAPIPLLQQAADKGIPVIAFDSYVDSDLPLATAATDNYGGAALAADKLAELIGGSGEVALIAQDNTSSAGRDRVNGFTDRINEEYPDITIVDTQFGAGDHLLSTDLAKAIITANPNLKGFFGANEGSVVGIINAVTELGKEGLVIVGFDSGIQQLEAIRSGLQAGAITQDPIGIGYKCIEAAVKAINGEEIPKFINTGFHWYDASNMDDPDIKPLLYE